jgi:hypothetical protein
MHAPTKATKWHPYMNENKTIVLVNSSFFVCKHCHLSLPHNPK